MDTRQFEGTTHAELYSRFRLSYAPVVYESIRKYCSSADSSGFNLVVDVGCGNGQSTFPLTKIFEHVIGCDISENQIKEAKKKYPNIDFQVSPGEKLEFLQDSSVDLVTIALALHWLDKEKFYAEVTRVLRPGGSLVVYGSNTFEILHQAEAQSIIKKFNGETLDKYWSVHVRDTQDFYRDYELPYAGWERNDSLYLIQDMTVDNVVGELSTSSACQNYLKEHPGSKELQQISQRLKSIYTEGMVEQPVKIKMKYFMLMGRKPHT